MTPVHQGANMLTHINDEAILKRRRNSTLIVGNEKAIIDQD